SAREFDDMAPSASAVLVTGAQGSPNAALTRAVEGKHPTLTLDPKTDIVLFCAPVIPGQEGQHARLMAMLKNAGIKCLTRADATLYSQAHARLPELLEMIKLTQPDAILPVHGDCHLRGAAREAYTKAGYNALSAENGAVIDVKKDGGSAPLPSSAPTDYIGLKTLQGTQWNDRHYVVTHSKDAEPQVPQSRENHKRPKIYDLRPKKDQP
ncbi:MAG: MBL fold metallo-hydrolase RNA specificity domain-containing protein, partial [Bdellovibrionales bacterium]